MAASATHDFADTLPTSAALTPGFGSSVKPTPAFQVIGRSGSFSSFDPSRISIAITKAFIAVEGNGATESRRIHEAVETLTRQIVDTLTRRADAARAIHIEDIQDQVELALMRSGEHKIARAYVLYRDERAQERKKRADLAAAPTSSKL